MVASMIIIIMNPSLTDGTAAEGVAARRGYVQKCLGRGGMMCSSHWVGTALL